MDVGPPAGVETSTLVLPTPTGATLPEPCPTTVILAVECISWDIRRAKAFSSCSPASSGSVQSRTGGLAPVERCSVTLAFSFPVPVFLPRADDGVLMIDFSLFIFHCNFKSFSVLEQSPRHILTSHTWPGSASSCP
ncbi:hypothetical protein MSAN_02216300 [Mycena sanguinolenta]|uniref:Uncharacterized protein n=1 Tax=Mycena sanguinolenta TaxID=230812 RepID=A0A8H7CID8_9AGAR|nr:hypothetical protein MSAN_02216300 [Mycena sanguinolenta]